MASDAFPIASAAASTSKKLDEVPPSDPLIGTVLQHSYVIDRRIGHGGMSHIYEAHHLRLEGHRFAVKVLLAELATDEALVARFGREIKAVASIDHPRVVRVYDFGVTSQGWPYMVSEFLVGMDLAAWLQNFGALPLDTVFHVGRGLAEALSTTHAHGVIHRDLKPSNVFLVGDFAHGPPKAPEVKILDFGLSRFLDRDDGLTKTRLVLGTPAYMSPEQARGERGDRLSDIYGLGAVLYTAVTGEAPFRGSTPEQTVLSVLSAKPVRPRKLKPQIPEGLELVIQCAMAKEPRDRYRDVGDVALSLSNLAGRPSPTTLARLEQEARRARSLPMRLQLLGVCSLGVVWVAGAVATGAASALELSGATLSLTPVTVALSSFAVAGGVVIAGRVLSHLRREVWPNTDRVLAWLRATRSGLAAAVMAYGVAALAVRLVERAYLEVSLLQQVAPVQELAWPGWSLAFSLISLAWGTAFAIGRRPSHRNTGQTTRWTPTLSAGASLASLTLLAWGWSSPAALPNVAVARLDSSISLAAARRPPTSGSGERNNQAQRAGPDEAPMAPSSPASDAGAEPQPETETEAGVAGIIRVVDLDPPLDAGARH